MTPPQISLQGATIHFTPNIPGWSIGNLGQCHLTDYFNLSPAGPLSDPQLRLATSLANCVWGQRGHFWLEQTLTAGATVHFLTTGAGMSMQLTNQLYWQALRDLKVTVSLTFTGTYDSHSGWNGTVGFNSQLQAIDAKSTFVGAGISF